MPRTTRPTSPRGLSHTLLGLALVLLAIPAAAGGSAQGSHRIFLSAGAPWGEPGARSTFPVSCADTVSRDTLYLSFEPASDDSAFLTVSGDVYFYAQSGDTLGEYWQLEKGGRNHGGIAIQFGPDETFPQPQPWTVPGLAVLKYERTPQSACFRFTFAVPMTHPGPVKAGQRYVLGRILLGAKRSDLDGCERPVCIEWHTASLGFKARPMEFAKLGDSRWLTRGEAGANCRDRMPAWRPKKASGGASTPPKTAR